MTWASSISLKGNNYASAEFYPDTASITAGDILITEVMVDSNYTGETYGEYIELYNTLDVEVDVGNWQLWRQYDWSVNSFVNFTPGMTIPPRGYLTVLDNYAWCSANYGVSGLYFDKHITLHNTDPLKSDVILTSSDKTIIDRVAWLSFSNTIDSYSWIGTGVNVGSEGKSLRRQSDGYSYYDTNASADWVNNQWPSIGVQDLINDMFPPTYSNLIEITDPLELGKAVIIRINVTDPVGSAAINQVLIQFEGANHSMIYVSGDMWQFTAWTPGSTGNVPYTVYMEDKSHNWNSTSGAIDVEDTISPTFNNLIESADPLQLGQNETISINVYDTPGSGVNKTLLEYDLINHTMNFAGGDTWSWSNWKPSLVGPYTYKIYLEDKAGNWNMTTGDFTVVGTNAPVIENITKSADPLELGSNITITVDVSDEETYPLTVFIELGGVNRTMTNYTLGTWEYNFTFNMYGVGIGPRIFTIHANDTENNWNKYTSSFGVVDTTPPSPSNLTGSPDPAELGSIVTITLNVTDLAGIYQVQLEFGGGNHSMTNIDENTWHYNSWTPTSTGAHPYTIYMEDNNHNWNTTAESVVVQDTVNPFYSNLTESADPIELGTALILRINVTDVSGIKQVKVEFEGNNQSMMYVEGDMWEYNSWVPTSNGTYPYTIYMQDKSNNWNSTSGSIFVVDTISPWYSNLVESANPLELGNVLTITIQTFDLAGINQTLLQFEGINHSMTNVFGDTWQYNLWEPASCGDWAYYIFVEDKSSNWNSTTGWITVQDTIPPLPPVLSSGPSGDVRGNLTFDWLDGSDPSGIAYYRLVISTRDDPSNVSAYVFETNITNAGSESSYYKLDQPLLLGQYYYFLSQVDGVGHQSDFTRGTFNVVSGEISYIVIILVIAAAVGVTAAVVVLEKRKAHREFPQRKEIPLKLIISHINNIPGPQPEREEVPLKEGEGKLETVQKEEKPADEASVKELLAETQRVAEKLFAEGIYFEAQKHYKIASELLLKLGRKEEAQIYSELASKIKEASEALVKISEDIERRKSESNYEGILDLYISLIENSKILNDDEGVNLYQSELSQLVRNNKIPVKDLERLMNITMEQAASHEVAGHFEKAAEFYKKCENISLILIMLGYEVEQTNLKKLKEKRKTCLKNARSESL